MMSQNRQDQKDRLRGELDFDVNRRAHSEIQGLAQKLNLMGDRLADIQERLRERPELTATYCRRERQRAAGDPRLRVAGGVPSGLLPSRPALSGLGGRLCLPVPGRAVRLRQALRRKPALSAGTIRSNDCVLTKCLTDHQGKRFSKYPPGWSALLAIGVALKAPWLVDPILGALVVYLFLAHVERRHGPELERACGTLLVLNGFLVYYAASYRPHVADHARRGRRVPAVRGDGARSPRAGIRLLAAGALLGGTTLLRYLDFVPMAVWITFCLVRRRRIRHLLLFGAGFVLLAAGNLLYDQLLSGDPFTTPTRLYSAVGIHDRLAVSWRGFVVTGARLATLVAVFPPVLLLLASWRRHPPSPAARRGLALFGMSVALYFFYPAAVGGPGPRYLLAYFPFLVLAVVDGQSQLAKDDPSRARRFWVAAVCLQVMSSLVFLALEGRTLYGRRDLERTLAARRGQGQQLILLKTGTYTRQRAISRATRRT